MRLPPRIDADAEAGHDPDGRRESLVHEADAERVPHGEAADEAAGFAAKASSSAKIPPCFNVSPALAPVPAIAVVDDTDTRDAPQPIALPSSAASDGTCH